MNGKRWSIAVLGVAAIVVMAAPAQAGTVVTVLNASGTVDAPVVSGAFSGHGCLDQADWRLASWAPANDSQGLTAGSDRQRRTEVALTPGPTAPMAFTGLTHTPQMGCRLIERCRTRCIDMPWGMVCGEVCTYQTICG
jgi:hypothetical protein